MRFEGRSAANRRDPLNDLLQASAFLCACGEYVTRQDARCRMRPYFLRQIPFTYVWKVSGLLAGAISNTVSTRSFPNGR
jgi:hypothetical protein